MALASGGKITGPILISTKADSKQIRSQDSAYLVGKAEIPTRGLILKTKGMDTA